MCIPNIAIVVLYVDIYLNSMVIGEIIQQELRHQERTVSWLARKLNCNRQNVYDIFKRRTIDTELLMRISLVLNVNFFEIYSREYLARKNEDTINTQLIINNCN
jgi:hypothetical protein